MARDEKVLGFLNRPLEGDWPYLWIDATYIKVRQNNHIVSVAAIIAVGVNSDGRREVLGLDIGASEAEPFWPTHGAYAAPPGPRSPFDPAQTDPTRVAPLSRFAGKPLLGNGCEAGDQRRA
jgi:hypothetical protein